MRVSLMTTALSNNYGAVLQTYATARVIADAGIDIEVYRYFYRDRITQTMSRRQKLIHRVWLLAALLLTAGQKKRKYREFRKQIPLTATEYRCPDDLKKNPGDYDVYIAGSDQIWNPAFFVRDNSYFLDFVPCGKKKISYASSFGVAEFPANRRLPVYGELLEQFDSISVREESGVRIVEELCGKRATQVLDPTLLLDRAAWQSLVPTEKIPPFILCYVMPGDKTVTTAMEAVAGKLQKQTGLPIVRLGTKEYEVFRYGCRACDVMAGPLDFIRYFLNAEYVVTNSFHGTAFSVNFGKKLAVPLNDSLAKATALHERILSLLHLVGAEECLAPVSELREKMPVFPDLSAQTVQKKLEKAREESLKYLFDCLK